jgi:pimeloyl-ACP methyl ester carboxylesterase
LRGTGAGALRCSVLQRAMGSSDLYPPPPSAVRACARKLGWRRQFYGTDDVVADIDDLRAALRVSRLTIDGISYGTFVGERYTIAHPKRVTRLVLDSVVPHNVNALSYADAFPEYARVLRAACADAHCSTDPAADLAHVVAKRHDGVELLDAITFVSIFDPSFTTPANLFDILAAARKGRMKGLDDFVAAVRRFEMLPSTRLSQGLHASALCSDFRFPWGTSAAPLSGRKRALTKAAAALPAKRLWPFDRQTAAGNGFIQQCLPWPPVAPTPAAARRLPRVPTLLLAGTHDLSTPMNWGARRELKLAPQGQLVTIDGAGHSVQAHDVGGAAARAVRTFLLGGKLH